jgi:hypothetical protein
MKVQSVEVLFGVIMEYSMTEKGVANNKESLNYYWRQTAEYEYSIPDLRMKKSQRVKNPLRIDGPDGANVKHKIGDLTILNPYHYATQHGGPSMFDAPGLSLPMQRPKFDYQKNKIVVTLPASPNAQVKGFIRALDETGLKSQLRATLTTFLVNSSNGSLVGGTRFTVDVKYSKGGPFVGFSGLTEFSILPPGDNDIQNAWKVSEKEP